MKSPPQASGPPQASLRSGKKEDVLPKIIKITKTPVIGKFVKSLKIGGTVRLVGPWIVQIPAVYLIRSSLVFDSCSAGPLGLGCSGGGLADKELRQKEQKILKLDLYY